MHDIETVKPHPKNEDRTHMALCRDPFFSTEASAMLEHNPLAVPCIQTVPMACKQPLVV